MPLLDPGQSGACGEGGLGGQGTARGGGRRQGVDGGPPPLVPRACGGGAGDRREGDRHLRRRAGRRRRARQPRGLHGRGVRRRRVGVHSPTPATTAPARTQWTVECQGKIGSTSIRMMMIMRVVSFKFKFMFKLIA